MPQAGIQTTIPADAGSDNQCPIAGQYGFELGPGNPIDQPVANGQTLGGTLVSVSCTVSPIDGGPSFDVDLSAQFPAVQGGGSFALRGAFDGTTNPQPNISAQFFFESGSVALSSTSCTVTFPEAQEYGQGIAPGRVWGHVDCPQASGNYVCDVSADFRFENCGM